MNFLDLTEYKRLLQCYPPLSRHSPSAVDFWYTNCCVYPYHEREAGPYFLDYTGLCERKWRFDELGVLLLDYKGRIGLRHHPAAIGTYALGAHQRYIQTGSEKWRKTFLRQADWFESRQLSCGERQGAWENDFAWGELRPGWISSHGSSLALSVLLRAHSLTQKATYMQTAHKAFTLFARPAAQGGFLVQDGFDRAFFLSAVPAQRDHFILNKMCFALLGLYEYFLYTENGQAGTLFARGVEGLKAQLENYHLGRWSKYDLDDRFFFKNPASVHYHKLHVLLLEVLFDLTAEELFEETFIKWDKALKSRRMRVRACLAKGIYKIMVK